MAMDYSPERIATMAAELVAAARALGITLTPDGELGGKPSGDCGSQSEASDLVVALLEASSGWALVSGSRASGPFGAFLAGTQAESCAGTAPSVCAHIDDIIAALSRTSG